MGLDRYKIPEGHQMLVRNDGTFCFIAQDGYKDHQGPLYPIGEENKNQECKFPNHLNWIHIMDKQPKNGENIIELHPPYEGHYRMGMRQYTSFISWEQYMDFCKLHNISPDFWWIYANDYPFPQRMT